MPMPSDVGVIDLMGRDADRGDRGEGDGDCADVALGAPVPGSGGGVGRAGGGVVGHALVIPDRLR